MSQLILVAGATGNLGQRICGELIRDGVQTRAIVRSNGKPEKINALKKMGVDIVEINNWNINELAEACAGVSCVVSALAGLRDTIVSAQRTIVDAAIAAGVPRFIPSDFCCDFTEIPSGENRNFDVRREFHDYLNSCPIRASSIFNGCFAEMLRYNMPFYNVPEKTIGYLEDKENWEIDFTTMQDTAAFTAKVAVDDSSPRYLRIASFSISANELLKKIEQLKGLEFHLMNMGTMESFSAYNKQQRQQNPEGEQELYPRWQQAQYLYSMFYVHHQQLDNDRYSDLHWSPVDENI